jgi:hypothetical protein
MQFTTKARVCRDFPNIVWHDPTLEKKKGGKKPNDEKARETMASASLIHDKICEAGVSQHIQKIKAYSRRGGLPASVQICSDKR